MRDELQDRSVKGYSKRHYEPVVHLMGPNGNIVCGVTKSWDTKVSNSGFNCRDCQRVLDEQKNTKKY